MSEDNRTEQALLMILNACDQQLYVPPYDVVLSDTRGTHIAARFSDKTPKPLAGDLGSGGKLYPPLSVFVTDTRGESASFSVELFDREDGRPIAPIITYPDSWTRQENRS